MAGTRQFNEIDMLEKALALFWKQGYHATSMIDLANETGIQRGSLYNAYKNKSTVFLKAFENYSEQLLQTISQSLNHPNLEVALHHFFESMVRRLCEDPQHKGCLSTRTIMEATEADQAIMEQLRHLLDRCETLLKTRLEQGKIEGQISGDTKSIAQYLVALSRGIAVIERVYYDQSRIQKIYTTAIQSLNICKI